MSDVQRETLTLSEAAVMLGVHRVTAYTWAKQGRFPVPVIEVGRLKKVSRRQLEDYINPPPAAEGAEAAGEVGE